ncbi:MAG: fibronectin type III domain-containing protein [Patescibacteria group bacterium]
MFKKLVINLLFLLFFIIVVSSFQEVKATLIIDEFSSASTTEWVELLNTDQINSVSLTGYEIRNNSGTTLKTLSGTVPRMGFLTFEFSSGSLTNAGDCLILWNGSSGIYSVSYGTGSCTGGTNSIATAPTSSETGALINNSWQIDTTPSRGWCNDTTGGCPTIATIVSSMNANGVKTNLADQSDFSRITGLYFQKSETNDPNGNPIGKITFLSEMNFTDQDALSWMQNLGSNIDMSTKGKIGLNAELIKNLTSTNASLTMYGLTLQNPTLQVANTDGSAGDSGIVSGLTYSGGALTFTAAHFTTFTAVESSSGGLSAPKTPTCEKESPNKAPHLFQIDTTKNSAKLFFSPVNNAVDNYYIAYGLSEGDERFGVKFDKGFYDGVINYTINELAPNTKYYFKVRAGNGCATGNWSNWLTAKTDGGLTSSSIKELAVEPTKSVSSPTLGVSDYVPSSQPASQPTIKKSWLEKLIGFFTNLFK